uniref:hypothetical protein n=1 Tax=uncultured Secundilactobacillus sp. TaxID=2813935 RepID=UPI00258DD096
NTVTPTSNQVGIAIKDTTGKTLGTVLVNRQTGETSAVNTITNQYAGLNTTSPATDVIAKLASAAGVSGYSTTGLSDGQKADNAAAIQNASYGATATYVLQAANVKPAFTNATLNADKKADGTSDEPTGAYVEGSKSGLFETLKGSFLADPALKDIEGATVTPANVLKALTDNGLNDLYTVYDQTTGKFLTAGTINTNLDGHNLVINHATIDIAGVTAASANNAFKVQNTAAPSFTYTVNKKAITNFSFANSKATTFQQLFSQGN